MTYENLDEEARQILRDNDRGGYTVPTSGLYPYQWNWDSAFAAWGFSTFDNDRAWVELETLFASQWEDGMVPHIIFHRVVPEYFPGPDVWGAGGNPPTSGISQPPIAATMARAVYEADKQAGRPRLEALYEGLLNWHRWFMAARITDGLCCVTHPWESGRDNAPDWDKGMAGVDTSMVGDYKRRDTGHVDNDMRPTKEQYDQYLALLYFSRDCGWDIETINENSPLRVADPGMHFMLLRAHRDLKWIAEELAKPDVAEIRGWIDAMVENAAKFWNPDGGFIDSIDMRSGEFTHTLSCASFYCWYAGIDETRMIPHLERILAAVKYPVPSYDPDGSGFDHIRYWRGPLWCMANSQIGSGLAEMGYADLAEKVRLGTRAVIADHGFAEYHSPVDGTPAGGQHFTWTAAAWLTYASPQAKEVSDMGAITLKAVEKWFGDVQVIKGVDLEINDGEFVIFVGPSGCGKSTLLRMIGGLEEISRGSLLIDGEDVTDHPPAKRGLTMVFQSYALYPHMSVAENMGFSLKTAGALKAEIEAKVAEAARVLKLEPYLERRPKDLSGGQRQRVAIGRSIVRDPTAFLFDEPLSNLDAALRVEMRYEIAKLSQNLNTTMIYVTHDQIEAMTLADRIVVLEFGTIAQIGTPKELYERPANLFVAQFIGSPKMNILPCTTGDGRFHLEGGRGGAYGFGGNAVSVGARPEHITLGEAGEGACDGVVDLVEYLGADTYVIIDGGPLGQITVRGSSEDPHKPGDKVGIIFDERWQLFFDADGFAVTA